MPRPCRAWQKYGTGTKTEADGIETGSEKMEKLVFLNNVTNEVIILSLSEKQTAIEEQYETTDEWLSEEGIDAQLGIDLNYCQYLWMGDNVTLREVKI